MKRFTVGKQNSPELTAQGLRGYHVAGSSLYRPVDHYENLIPSHLREAASDYLFLLAPSMGQHLPGYHPGWCGRTCAAMIRNYQYLASHPGPADPSGQYIEMSTAGGRMELWKPDGSVAWDGFGYGGLLQSEHEYKDVEFLETHFTPSECATKKLDPAWVRAIFEKSKILPALRARNPVLICTRFSTSGQHKHIILISGYAEIGGELWLMILNPAPFGSTLFKREEIAALPTLSSIQKLAPTTNLIQFQAGDWNMALGGIGLIRASHLFDPHPTDKGKLLYDGLRVAGETDRSRGSFQARDKLLQVPDDLVLSSHIRSSYSYPFGLRAALDPAQPPPQPSPLAYYAAVEQQGGDKAVVGGLYPLGLEAMLHSGVHLHSPCNGELAVQAMAPGEVVALRMGARDNVSQHDLADAKQRNWSNFVLLRHSLKVGTAAAQDFYTLYMHLAPPSWWQLQPTEKPGKGVEIPWLRRWTQGRFGVMIKIRASERDEFPIGTIAPLVEKLDPAVVDGFRILPQEGVSFRKTPVWDPNPEIKKPNSLSVPASTSIADAAWIYLAPPAHMDVVCQALEQGKTLFLDGHYLRVKTGETVGLVAAYPTGPKKVVPAGTQTSPATGIEMSSSFIHWEVFALQPDLFNSLIAPFAARGVAWSSLTVATPANPTELAAAPAALVGQLNTSLHNSGGLTVIDAGLPVPIVPMADDYPRKVLGFFNRQSHQTIEEMMLYLDLSECPRPAEFLPALSPARASFTLTVGFYHDDSGAEGKKYRPVGAEQTLTLPAAAWESNPSMQSVLFQALPGCSIGDVDLISLQQGSIRFVVTPKSNQVDWTGFGKRIKPLWRNLLLTHDSEWTPAVAQNHIHPDDGSGLTAADLGWWSAQTLCLKAGDPPAASLEAMTRALPTGLGAGTQIVGIHPITLKWLLEAVQRSPLELPIAFEKDGPMESLPVADRSSYPRTIQFLDTDTSRPLPCGGLWRLLVIDLLYYGSGLTGSAKLLLEPLLPGSAPSRELDLSFGSYGIAQRDFPMDVWGAWQLFRIDGAVRSAPIPLAVTAPQIDRELLATPVHKPMSMEGDRFRWTIPWKPGTIGAHLTGVVELVTKIGGVLAPTGVGVIPLTREHLEPKSRLLAAANGTDASWTVSQGWVVTSGYGAAPKTGKGKQKAASNGLVTDNYKISEWRTAAGGAEFRVHSQLVRAIQDLRMLVKAGFVLTELEPNGLEVVLRINLAADAEILEHAALSMGIFERVELDLSGTSISKVTPNKFCLRVAVDGGATEHTGLDFDLRPALDCLMDRSDIKIMLEVAAVSAAAAAKVRAAAAAVESVAKVVPGGAKAAKGAAKAKKGADEVDAEALLEYTVAFHLIPSHFLKASERSGSLIEPSEWATLLTYAYYVAPPPGLTIEIPQVGAVACLATDMLGSIGSQSFEPPRLSQTFPAKAGGAHQIVLTCGLTGATRQWQQIAIRLALRLGDQSLVFHGSKNGKVVTFAIPWPVSELDSLEGFIEGVPTLLPNHDPTAPKPMVPVSQSVSIPLRPDWRQVRPRYELVKDELSVQMVIPGLKGSDPKAKKPTPGADRVEIEVFGEGAGYCSVKGMHPHSVSKSSGDSRSAANLTYGESSGLVGFLLPKPSSPNPIRFVVTLTVGTASPQRFHVQWDGGQFLLDGDAEVYDRDEEDLWGEQGLPGVDAMEWSTEEVDIA